MGQVSAAAVGRGEPLVACFASENQNKDIVGYITTTAPLTQLISGPNMLSALFCV